MSTYSPLFFDRVNEGRPPNSNSLLFQLPVELLGVITQYFSQSSLASLSLVSKDCRQLARSCRFGHVQFDLGTPQICMLEKLQEEAEEREANDGYTVSPSIGACIRQLRIVSNEHDIDLAELTRMEKKRRMKRVRKWDQSYFDDYFPSIALILAGALPHLELLHVQMYIPLSRSIFNALACSSIQHLKLCWVKICEEFKIALPQALAHLGWPLRTLHLELYWCRFEETRGCLAPLCTNILRLCAPTLEKLVLRTVPITHETGLQSLASDEPPPFVQLRELTLRSVTGVEFLDHSILKRLILPQPESRLIVLDVDAEDGSLLAQFLEGCGTIRSLKTFVWDATCLTPDQPFTFLRNNSQLSKLRISLPQTPAVLDERILPILSQSFQELKSLSLTWQGSSIPIPALALIGTLRGLQQIHLSAGPQDPWRCDWVIKHREMREHLKELRDLKKLAFTCDSYGGRWSCMRSCYDVRSSILEEIPEDLEGPDNVWRSEQIYKRQCRRRTLAEADEYVRVLPRLEWVYFGKISMGVFNAKDGQGREVVVLSEEGRYGYDDFLWRIFGRETCDD